MFVRIFTVLLLGLAFKAVAQRDLIITQAGEQIRCKIVDESSMRFSYVFVNEKGKPVKTEIFKTLISSFRYNYFPEDLPSGKKGALGASVKPGGSAAVSGGRPGAAGSAPVRTEGEVPAAARRVPSERAVAGGQKTYVSPLKGKTEFTNYLKYRIGFKGGLGNVVDKNENSSDWGLFNEKLRRGWVYGVDAAVFLNDHFGVGVAYHSYQSKNKNSRFDFPNRVTGNDFRTGSLESKINHTFVGPSLLGRVGMDYKTFIVATVSPGYYFYNDKGIENQMNYVYKGGTWGGAATLGLDFLLGSNETGRDVILSFECGYNYGRLKTLDYGGTTGRRDLATPVSLSRLDFTVGLRFTRFPRYLR